MVLTQRTPERGGIGGSTTYYSESVCANKSYIYTHIYIYIYTYLKCVYRHADVVINLIIVVFFILQMLK